MNLIDNNPGYTPRRTYVAPAVLRVGSSAKFTTSSDHTNSDDGSHLDTAFVIGS